MRALKPGEEDARRCLEGMGFSVTRVTEGVGPTCDFLVEGDGEGYCVEEKTRLLPERISDPPTAAEYMRAVQAGDDAVVEPISNSMHYDPKVGSWLQDATRQLKAVDPARRRLRFLWCSAGEPSIADVQCERIIRTLYGVLGAYDVFRLGDGEWFCYYAAPAALDRFREVDGVIVVNVHAYQAAICLNESSPRYREASSSRLVAALREAGASEHPLKKNGRAAILPRTKSRAEAQRALQTLLGNRHLTFWANEVHYMDAVALTPSAT